ncbi:GNAT family N-acetyltransferase [Lachnospiraceae bacterium NSJ-143]|nr:GNAT family N-acetyltransferase [Lachnospiraceae bacterium NSJ-143]
MLRLRPYKTSDCKYLKEWISGRDEFFKWCADLFEYPLNEENIKKAQAQYDSMQNAWFFTVLDKDGEPVGFFMISNADYNNNSANIGFVVIDTEKRGLGYGKELIELAKKYAFDMLGVKRLTLKVFDDNHAAHKCYLSAGFRDTDYVKKHFDYCDRLWGCYCMEAENESG